MQSAQLAVTMAPKGAELERHYLITVPELAAEALGAYLGEHLSRRFASTHADLTELIPSIARTSLECIGNSDALYHNVEHTMLVTLVGYDIMKGRSLLTPTYPSDYAHLLVACLLHDIGYVRGILKGDGADGYVIDAKGNKAKLPRGSSDAALLPYHVDRSKLFVMDRMAKIELLDRRTDCRRDRIYPLSVVARAARIRQRGGPLGARRRSYRPARRPALSAQGQCAVLTNSKKSA